MTDDVILDETLDDLADLPEFKPYPNGAHVATLTLEIIPAKDKKPQYYKASFKYVQAAELENPTDVSPNPGDQFSIFLHTKKKDGTPNEIGQGQLKVLAGPIGEKLGLRSVREICEATKSGIQVMIVTKTRKQDGYPDTMNINKCAVV